MPALTVIQAFCSLPVLVINDAKPILTYCCALKALTIRLPDMASSNDSAVFPTSFETLRPERKSPFIILPEQRQKRAMSITLPASVWGRRKKAWKETPSISKGSRNITWKELATEFCAYFTSFEMEESKSPFRCLWKISICAAGWIWWTDRPWHFSSGVSARLPGPSGKSNA